MKVWVTRWALTEGVLEMDVNWNVYGDYLQGRHKESSVWLSLGKDAFESREDSVVEACRMRDERIVSLKKQLAKLEAMEF